MRNTLKELSVFWFVYMVAEVCKKVHEVCIVSKLCNTILPPKSSTCLNISDKTTKKCCGPARNTGFNKLPLWWWAAQLAASECVSSVLCVLQQVFFFCFVTPLFYKCAYARSSIDIRDMVSQSLSADSLNGLRAWIWSRGDQCTKISTQYQHFWESS